MSDTTTRPSILVGPSKTDIAVLQSTHMTASVTTASGSCYTVVTRPGVGVVLVNDTDGWATMGGGIKVIQGRMCLYSTKGQVIARTTKIERVYIMSN